MDQNETQDLRRLSQFTKSYMLKKITQLLLSVSLISFFLSDHLSVVSFIHSLDIYFLSTFPVKLFSHAIDKNCIFLVCNGLLVVVAKYSGLLASSSSSKPSSSSYNKISFDYYEDVVSQPSDSELRVLKQEALADDRDRVFMEEEKENDEKKVEEVKVKDADKSNVEENGGGEAREESESHVQVMQEDEDQDEVDEGNGLLSTEELNKKFDEFIRKMKEGIRIESQQKVVVVN